MAATVNGKSTVTMPYVYKWDLSSLTSDQLETLTYSDFTTLTPVFVTFCTTTQATDHSAISMDWTATTASSSQINVRFKAENGGSLSGAVVRVLAFFAESASGGISF
jgi:hypothetical protein